MISPRYACSGAGINIAAPALARIIRPFDGAHPICEQLYEHALVHATYTTLFTFVMCDPGYEEEAMPPSNPTLEREPVPTGDVSEMDEEDLARLYVWLRRRFGEPPVQEVA